MTFQFISALRPHAALQDKYRDRKNEAFSVVSVLNNERYVHCVAIGYNFDENMSRKRFSHFRSQ